MSSRLPTIFDDLFPDTTPEFRAIADVWPAHVVKRMLTLVWEGFDRLKAHVDFKKLDFTRAYAQLERSLTDLHMDEITLLWHETGDSFESFIPKHEPWEWQGLNSRSSRPHSCDLGFVLRSNRRIRWAVEAKVLQSSTAIADYLADLEKFLDGRSAPFSTESALAAYLISGVPEEVFSAIAAKLHCELKRGEDFPSRPHRCSHHERSSEKLSKLMPTAFICHHLVFSLN
jgi:hypothetical protein